MDALGSASSMHMWGAFPVEGAQAHIDAHLGPTRGYVSIRRHGQEIQVLTVNGETYVRGNDAFETRLVQAALLPKLRGKWLHFPRSYERAHLAALTRLTLIQYWQTGIAQAAAGSSYQDGGPKIVRGMATSSVFDKASSTFLYFPQTGTPYPVAFSSNAHFANLNFDGWDKPVHVAVPPARQTAELTPR